MAVKLSPDWLALVGSEFEQPYMQTLKAKLAAERQQGQIHYPPAGEWFAALDRTPPASVRVVILGQDPYHGPNQAHGLSFSVRRGQRPPPSLQNIFRELATDLRLPTPRHGELTAWADQGVLLLNSVLSVRAGEAASHQGLGWERFTDALVAQLNASQHGIVFMLWGGYAQKKGRLIDRGRHLVLTAAHPSPLAANRGGWFGSRHFSQANAWLLAQGHPAIDWSLPD